MISWWGFHGRHNLFIKHVIDSIPIPSMSLILHSEHQLTLHCKHLLIPPLLFFITAFFNWSLFKIQCWNLYRHNWQLAARLSAALIIGWDWPSFLIMKKVESIIFFVIVEGEFSSKYVLLPSTVAKLYFHLTDDATDPAVDSTKCYCCLQQEHPRLDNVLRWNPNP